MENKFPPIISFIGPSGSGKTTVIVNLVKTMKEYKIATTKFIHHKGITIDVEGKDTNRFRKAGSPYTISFTPSETVLLIKKEKRDKFSIIPEILNLNENVLPKVDFIFSEGPKDLPKSIPVIICSNNERDLQEYFTMVQNKNKILAISGVVSSHIEIWNNYPVFNANNANDLKKLVNIIIDSSSK
ncbi:MAG: hypothetical protein HeimC3_05930 [Candidatus Heimdallarchaeota archaeon LC_3]|nr:MAG: hypothetical protein HeimC3_05930 [Candidatus Heimdallarchaeota archaeon LC_3]